MEHGDRQFHQGQGHFQGHGDGEVSTGFDTFVMTGDMIIKTTPKSVAPFTRPKSSETSTTGLNMGDVTHSETVLPQIIQQPFNGGSEVPLQMGVPGCSRFPELDIPPDDISSEDEQYRTDCSEDLDITNLPPPPAEFFGDDFSDPCSTSDVWQLAGLPGGDGIWRNSLDKAIMRLETHTTTLAEARMGHNIQSMDKVLATGRASSSGSLVPSGVGVRASKSQDNWLPSSDSAGVGFVNIDVDRSSASVEALHHDLSTTSNNLDAILLQNRSDETLLVDDVWRRHTDISGDSKLLSNSAAKGTTNIVDSAEWSIEGNIDTVEPPFDYRDSTPSEHMFYPVKESGQSSGQRLLGGGKTSLVRQPPPFQNGTDVSATDSNHHIPAQGL